MIIPQGGFAFMAFSPYTPPPPKVTRSNPLDRYTPVTDAMLAAPAASEWLGWRRKWDAHGFSPLNQITKANIASLRVAWSWSASIGPDEGVPLVHDGVLFVHGMGDRVQALDAQSGDLLWEYHQQLPQGVSATVKRGMALYRDRLYIGTSDANVIALEVKTGKVVWIRDRRYAGPRRCRRRRARRAPGKIIVGTTGAGVGAKPGGRRSSVSTPTPASNRVAREHHRPAGAPGGR